MRFTGLALRATALLSTIVNGATVFSPARPPAIPLAVRNPYMNTYLLGGNGTQLPGGGPAFWNGSTTTWTGMIRVDGTSYLWMGLPPTNMSLVTQTAFSYTSTRSTFTMNVNNIIQMVIEFLSPVSPTDVERQSFPVSYLTVNVTSLDGKSHSVQLYTDVGADWASGDRNATIQWTYGVIPPSGSASKNRRDDSIERFNGAVMPELIQRATPGGIAYHRFYRQQQLTFAEYLSQAEWGNWYYAASNTAGLTYQSGDGNIIRNLFLKQGYLANTVDPTFRSASQNAPAFAFANKLGTIKPGTVSSTAYTINLAQTSAIQFEGYGGVRPQPPLWIQFFKSDLAAVRFFYRDYSYVAGITAALDAKIASDSIAAGGQNYLIATSLAVRQAFAATQLAGNATAPFNFMKEISSDGNVNTADVIFPWHPLALYLNPNLLKWTLDPLFVNQEAGYWPKAYAMHDIGSLYPNGTGHNDGKSEQMPVEESGNMIIMSLAYAQRANDTAYLALHYPILKQWNQFLVAQALIPRYQLSTDDFAGRLANQTNLALKGIIGIAAMSQIAQLTGNTADAQNFSSIAQSYIQQWYTLGIAQNESPPHTTLGYGLNDTYGLLYNLYADRELGLGLVSQDVYDMQSAFYPTVAEPFGVPLDTRHDWTKADWQMMVAAISSPSTQSLFINAVANFIDQTSTTNPFQDLYQASNATNASKTFKARPVVGGMFALLALQSAPTPANV